MTIIYESLFPTAVGTTFLDRDFTQSETDFFTSQKGNTRFNKQNKTSENDYIFQEDALKDIKAFCETEVNKYFQEIYQPCTDVSLYITQAWINFNDSHESHHQHTHANSFISGVFYIDVEKETDKITFFKPQGQLSVDTKNYNLFNSHSWWFNVENKKLLLFPSTLAHAVEPSERKKTRVSISFNTFFKGNIGNQKGLTELKL
jgi:uncharacterized protein (TIGR02466 family)